MMSKDKKKTETPTPSVEEKKKKEVIRGVSLRLVPITNNAIDRLQAIADKAQMLMNSLRAKEISIEEQGKFKLYGIAYSEVKNFVNSPTCVKETIAQTATRIAHKSRKCYAKKRLQSLWLYPSIASIEQGSGRFEKKLGIRKACDFVEFVKEADLNSDAIFTVKDLEGNDIEFRIPMDRNRYRIEKLRKLAERGKLCNEPLLTWKDGKILLSIAVIRKPKLKSLSELKDAKEKLVSIGVDLNAIHGIAVAIVNTRKKVLEEEVFKVSNPLLSTSYIREIEKLQKCGSGKVAGRKRSKTSKNVKMQFYAAMSKIVEKALELREEGYVPVIAVEKLNYDGLVKSLKRIREEKARNAVASMPIRALKKLKTLALWYDLNFIQIPPKGTSRTCFACQKETLEWNSSEREKRCPYCKRIVSRHRNSARNIAWRAVKQVLEA